MLGQSIGEKVLTRSIQRCCLENGRSAKTLKLRTIDPRRIRTTPKRNGARIVSRIELATVNSSHLPEPQIRPEEVIKSDPRRPIGPGVQLNDSSYDLKAAAYRRSFGAMAGVPDAEQAVVE
jgi:hypothetical protein